MANRYAVLLEVYEAAEALHACEDFEEMPTLCLQCGPRDAAAYQAVRHRLYDALTMARAMLEPSIAED